MRREIFAVMGASGKVGGHTALHLRKTGASVRAIVRQPGKGEALKREGCEVAVGDLDDTAALTTAFSEASACFVMLPPLFDPAPAFDEARRFIASLAAALRSAAPDRVVALSTIGAQPRNTNLLSQLTMLENELSALPIPVTFLRAAWFLENSSHDLQSARADGVIRSFLQPLDKPFPMVATADVGRLAAQSMQQQRTGARVMELEGPERVTPNRLAECFSKALAHAVRAEAPPRSSWETLFREHGMNNPLPRIAMLDGFNEGWIEFETGPAHSLKGDTTAEVVIEDLARNA